MIDEITVGGLSRAAKVRRSSSDESGDAHQLAIPLDHCIKSHLGLRLRIKEVRARVKRFARKFDLHWDEAQQEMIIPPTTARDDLDSLYRELVIVLRDIENRPLTPKMLLKALPLTNRERLRWTKDGRLRTSGRLNIRQGEITYAFPTYAPHVVEELSQNPNTILTWRRADAGT